MWSVDGKYVLFNSGAPEIRGPARVSVEGGPIEPALTFPAVGSLSRDGRLLAYADETFPTSTWRAELASAGGRVLSVKNIRFSSTGEDSPQLSPDAKHLLVRSGRGGKGELWRTDLDGQDLLQLTRTVRG